MDRYQLDEWFEQIAPGNVWFQPPEGTELSYPCIIYGIEGEQSEFADNVRYKSATRYDITVIDTDPDNLLYKKILDLPQTSLESVYVSDRLYHYKLTMYY